MGLFCCVCGDRATHVFDGYSLCHFHVQKAEMLYINDKRATLITKIRFHEMPKELRDKKEKKK